MISMSMLAALFPLLFIVLSSICLDFIISSSATTDTVGKITDLISLDSFISNIKDNFTLTQLADSFKNSSEILTKMENYHNNEIAGGAKCNALASKVTDKQTISETALLCSLLVYDYNSIYTDYKCDSTDVKMCSGTNICTFDQLKNIPQCKCNLGQSDSRYCIVEANSFERIKNLLNVTGAKISLTQKINLQEPSQAIGFFDVLKYFVVYHELFKVQDELLYFGSIINFYNYFQQVYQTPSLRNNELLRNTTTLFMTYVTDYIHRYLFFDFETLFTEYGNEGVFSTVYFHKFGKTSQKIWNTSSLNITFEGQFVKPSPYIKVTTDFGQPQTSSPAPSPVPKLPTVYIPSNIAAYFFNQEKNTTFIYLSFFENVNMFNMFADSPEFYTSVISVKAYNISSNKYLAYPNIFTPMTITAPWNYGLEVDLSDNLRHVDFCYVFEYISKFHYWITTSLASLNKNTNKSQVSIDLYKFGVFAVTCEYTNLLFG